MPELRLHCVFLIPHLAINADVPVLVHHDVVIALVQHTQGLQAGRLCGRHVQRLTDTTRTCRDNRVILILHCAAFIMTESGSGAISVKSVNTTMY